MATLIPAVGDMRPVRPTNGETFSLQERQGFVGGYIEALRIDDRYWLFFNEEGKLMGMPYNAQATQMLHGVRRLPLDDYIVGDAVLCTNVEAGGDGTGEE